MRPASGARLIVDSDYFVIVASLEFVAERTVRDHRALSGRYPISKIGIALVGRPILCPKGMRGESLPRISTSPKAHVLPICCCFYDRQRAA